MKKGKITLTITDHTSGQTVKRDVQIGLTWQRKIKEAARQVLEKTTESQVEPETIIFTNSNIDIDLESKGQFETIALLQTPEKVLALQITGLLQADPEKPDFIGFNVRKPSFAFINNHAEAFFADLARLKRLGIPAALADDFFNKWKIEVLQ